MQWPAAWLAARIANPDAPHDRHATRVSIAGRPALVMPLLMASRTELKPGESFVYTSWTRIATPNGTMRGTFFCMTEDAHPFDAPIAEFGLTLASALH